MFWTSKLSVDADILAFLGSATILATLFKNWAIFFQSFGHTGNSTTGSVIFNEEIN